MTIFATFKAWVEKEFHSARANVAALDQKYSDEVRHLRAEVAALDVRLRSQRAEVAALDARLQQRGRIDSVVLTAGRDAEQAARELAGRQASATHDPTEAPAEGGAYVEGISGVTASLTPAGHAGG